MRAVAILGIGQTVVAEQWDKSIRDIATEAVRHALVDAGREFVECWTLSWFMIPSTSRTGS